MKNPKKKGTSKKREEKLILIKELNKINDEINVEQNNVEDLSVKIKNIDGQIFLGYHDIKILNVELKNKEIEVEEKRSHKLLSERNIENMINKYVLKCYENFLNNLTKNEIEIDTLSKRMEDDKKEQKSNKDFEKLTTVTSIKHLNKLNSIILSQNKIIDNINRKFTICLKKMKDNYSRKINMQRDKMDKERQKIIFNLQKEKNDRIKNILKTYNEKIFNIQNYFKLILDDQLDLIQKLEEEKLNKKKNYFSKRKSLEQLKKNISIQRKILEGVERDAYELEKNIVDYENLRNDLKKIKEKRKKQQKILHELKLETDVKKMLLTKITNEYKTIYDQNKMKLYDYLQKLLLENYFLETKMKLKNESLEVNTIELNKWKESNNPENNEILNNTLNEKFQDFNILKNEIEELIDVNEKNQENYKAIMHLNYFNNEDLDILKREEQINMS
ncbi:conserved Plasmodium protein, unknown function [Plasmodium sp. gorilla clade G2]|uniref:conserved Plasmodium protein, unknown function n=1 Tax=Plasmodium sp. gorilla clade G2 TaxID=880535 RepID=UPI000D213AD9|nr:conserved Plasmodium protein, unknown function [Plasmodium sp. gorilla clade G2]SOV12658.1 conserved Plasmodium protein, unknown function [Plasmodium sp. gorilla clade G2]